MRLTSIIEAACRKIVPCEYQSNPGAKLGTAGLKSPDSILTLFATQRDDPAILSHSFDSCPALLIGGSPFGGSIFGVSNFGKLFLVSIQLPKLYHSFLDRVCVDEVGRIVRHFG